MNWRIVIITLTVGAVCCTTDALAQNTQPAPATPSLTPQQSVSYSIGVTTGRRIKQDFSGTPLDMEMLLRGIQDAVESKPLLVPEEETRNLARDTYNQSRKRAAEERNASVKKNMEAQKAFLEENKAKEGITALESGLQYKVIKSGTGKTPTPVDRVKIKYTGRLLDGTVFETSDQHRDGVLETQVNKVGMPGKTEALLRMKEGDKWELYVPSNLGYGIRPVPNVQPGQLLIIELELLEVLPPPALPTPQPAQPIPQPAPTPAP